MFVEQPETEVDAPARALIAVASAGADARTGELLERRSQARTARHRWRRGWLVRRMLLLADLLGIAGALLATKLSFGGSDGYLFQGAAAYAFLVATVPMWVLLAKLHGLYDQDEERTNHPTTDDLAGVFHLVTSGVWLIYATAWLTGIAHPDLHKTAVFWALAIALITIARSLARALCRRSMSYLQNTVIVGAGSVGQAVARKLLRHPEYGLNLLGFVDSDPMPRQEGLEDVALLGPKESLQETIRILHVERVIIAFSNETPEETLDLIRSLDNAEVQIDIVPRLYELVSPRVQIDTIEGVPLVELPPRRIARSSFLIKRAIDIVGAVVGLTVLSPVFAYIAVRIKLDSPGPVFFRQTRLGRDQQEFTAFKFRTMRTDHDTAEHRDYIKRVMDPTVAPTTAGLFKLNNAVTPFGAWLRKTSLDELPQLINVLRGDMSLVGPRPCIRYETEHFLPHHFDRFLVPAGMTGLWQVTARAHASFREALDMDVAYARGWSLALDLRLLCRTPLEAFGRRATA